MKFTILLTAVLCLPVPGTFLTEIYVPAYKAMKQAISKSQYPPNFSLAHVAQTEEIFRNKKAVVALIKNGVGTAAESVKTGRSAPIRIPTSR
jgi:hypothetical protein